MRREHLNEARLFPEPFDPSVILAVRQFHVEGRADPLRGFDASTEGRPILPLFLPGDRQAVRPRFNFQAKNLLGRRQVIRGESFVGVG